MITNLGFIANYQCKSLSSGPYNSYELIADKYDYIMNSENPTQHHDYKDFIKSIAYFIQVASSNVNLDQVNPLVEKQIRKDAPLIIKFLKSKNFNFEPVKKLILQDAYMSQSALIYWNNRLKEESSKMLRKDYKEEIKFQQKNYYSCLIAINNLSNISNEYNEMFSLTDEVFSLKESIAKLGTKSNNLLLSAKRKAQQQLLKIKTQKLTKLVKKMGLTQTKLKDIINSKVESSVLQEALTMGESGKDITKVQEQAMIEKYKDKYSSLLNLTLDKSVAIEV